MHDLNWDLLSRYLAGEATPDERMRFEAWRDASLERQAFMNALLQATATPPALPFFTERDRVETWARLQQTIADERDGTSSARRFALPSPGRAWGRIAAAGVLLLGAAIGWNLLREADTPDSTVAGAHAERVLRTPRGQRATFRLPDGTRVILGPASTLRYAATYGQHNRGVRLQGEAYFAVTHDEQRPFLVYAADLVAQDLGTEFTVRAYAEDSRAVVVVREGEVGIRAAAAVDATVQVITPGELGRLSGHGEPVVEAVDLEPYFAWTDGRLVFDGTPLREALPYLSRWFDLDLRIGDTLLGGLPVTATLDQHPTADVLANIAASLGLTYVQEDSIVYFRRPTPRD